jgi:hypothetical protein
VATTLLETIAGTVEASGAPATATATDKQLEEARELTEWLPTFWSGLHTATDSEFLNCDALLASGRGLARLGADLAGLNAIPPFARGVRAAQDMADACLRMVEHYATALLASTPIEAQTAANRAQESLDELVSLDQDLNDWLARQQALTSASSVQESLGLLIAECFKATETDSLLTLVSKLQPQLAEVAGVECGPDAAISYGLNAAFVDLFLSPDDFNKKVRGGVDLLLAADERIRLMMCDPDFQTDARRLRLELFDSGVACQSAIAAAAHERQSARAVVDLHATLVESAGRILAIPFLTAAGQKRASYASLRGGNSTEHLRKAQSNPKTRDLFQGLDDHLRTAHSHRAISYEAEQLITDLSSGQREYSFSALIDSTFRAIESALAGLLAIQIVCSAQGWAEPDDTGLDALGFSPTEIAAFVLTSFGIRYQSVRVADGTLEVDLPGDIRGFTVAIGALLPSMPPSSFTAIRVTPQPGAAWSCPTEPYAIFRETSDDFTKQIALMRVQWCWRSETGALWLPERAFRKWTATQMVEAIDLNPFEKFRRLRLLRNLAKEVADQEAESLVRSYVRFARLQLADLPEGESERQTLQTVISWSTSPVDFDLI